MLLKSINTFRNSKKIPENLTGNFDGWIKYSETASTIIIFVHGFLSNGVDCWTNSDGNYWPKLVSEDLRFEEAAVFSAQYYTAKGSLDYGVADCASELWRSLSISSLEFKKAPLDFSRIIFVCHSLGGIVVRYMLCENPIKIKEKKIGLVLMASPSLGSFYADFFGGLSRVLGNKVSQQLSSKNQFLIDLDRRFRNLVDNKDCQICGVEAVETQFYVYWFLTRIFPTVVNWESAARYFGNPERVGGTNHSNIVKPNNVAHSSYKILLSFFLKEFDFRNKGTTVSEKKNSGRSVISKALFDAYDFSCKDFYYQRDIDDKIAATLEIYAVWVYGASGVGKTCLLKRYLDERKLKPIELSLSQLSENFTRESCLRELAETCSQFSDSLELIPPTLISVVNSLIEHAKKSSVVLYLDEIPIAADRNEKFDIFVGLISDLLILLKQRVGSSCNIVISSINRPCLKGNNKLSEQIRLLEIPTWSINELDELHSLIVNTVPQIEIDKNYLYEVLDECRGSPRFLKTFLKNKSLTGKNSDLLILRETKHQFDSMRNYDE